MAINFPASPTTNQTYTFNGRTWTWNGVGWQATGSTGLTVYTKTDFTATAGQTSFSATYTVGFVDVYYNGSKLSTSEYTATTGTTVVLGTACNAGDIVETIAWTISSSFNPSLGSASATSLAIGGATIGSNALAVTGTAAISGAVTAPTFNGSTLANHTRQVFLSGTAATYTTPANCRQLFIRMVGGGGGGGSYNNGSGGSGGNSIFNSITAAGGGYGVGAGSGSAGAGGNAQVGTGTASLRIQAENGVAAYLMTPGAPYSKGGNSGGGLGFGSLTGTPNGYGGGGFGATYSGSGGGGAGGEYVELIINTPAATYTYTVGAGGAAGSGSINGGVGGSGIIIVDEYY